MPVTVTEVTMATPDTICVEVRDPAVTPGHFQALGSADSGSYADDTGLWITRTNPTLSATDYCAVVGADKKYLKFQDVRSEEYLDREAAVVAGDYGTIGGLTVDAVYLRSEPYDFGEGRWNFAQMTNKATSSKHFLFLKLSGNLAAGTHTIDFPTDTGLDDYEFDYDDTETRAIGIRSTQHGHRSSDVSKIAYFALWIPGAPDEGAVDLSDYSLEDFQVIDENGAVQFSGTITERLTPTETESGTGFSRTSPRYASTTHPRAAITAMDITDPKRMTFDNVTLTTLANDDLIYLRGFSRNGNDGLPRVDISYSGALYTVANLSGDQFDISGGNAPTVIGAARLATAAVLPNSPTYNNGTAGVGATLTAGANSTLTVDGVVADLADVILVKNQASAFQNGLYTVTDAGSGGSPWVLTRATNFDTAAEMLANSYIYSTAGTANTNKGWFMTATVTTVGTTSATFVAYTFPNYGSEFVFKSHVANRAGTYVYDLDYSEFAPDDNSPGPYRLHIPGLGVSDPFLIHEGRWAQSAMVSAKGEYHQRTGMALDGRFGFTRPVNFKSGAVPVAGLTAPIMYKSTVPIVFTNYAAIVPNSIPINRATQAPYITATEETFWGGWHDAGDWDIRLQTTFPCIYFLLDLVERFTASRSIHFGIPPSSECIGSTYSGTDDLPDLVHQALWGLDGFRRTQLVTGEVIGGITYNKIGQGDTSDQGGYRFEPSWLFRGQAVSYAPDHIVTFCYAGAAAKMAKVLGVLGYSSLSSTWEASAILAWDRAEAIYTDQTTRDAFYATLKTNAGWSDTQYNNNISALQGGNYAQNYRKFAAGCLFALTGDSEYSDAIEADWIAGPFIVDTPGRAYGAWEYSQADGADPTIAGEMETQLVNQANLYTDYSEGTVAYRTIHHKILTMSFGLDCGNIHFGAFILSVAHQISGLDKYIAALQAGMCFVQGANQKGICLTTGMGARNMKAVLHLDSHAMGVGVPDGYTIYGYSEQSFVTSFNFQMGNVQYIHEPAVGGETGDYEAKRVMSPSLRRCFPLYESIFENYLNIEQMEYVTQDTILPAIYASIYLHCWDKPAVTHTPVRVIVN